MKQTFHNADFDSKVLQRVRFWIEIKTMRWISNLKFFDNTDFEKMSASKNHVLDPFTLWKRHNLNFSCLLKNMVLNWNFHYVSVFGFKSLTTREILDWNKNNALDFEFKIFRHYRFWKNVCIQKSRFRSFYSVKTTYFEFFLLFKKYGIKLELSLRVRFWIQKNTKR